LRTRGRHLVLLCGLALALGASSRAAAEDGAVATPSADSKAAARAHFDKGLAASTDQRFGEAVGEFERAYELWPDYHVLYNIGRVRVALGRPVEAVEAFEAYLGKGGGEIPADRRREVREAVAAELTHVATIAVRVSPDGAEVRLDGRLVGLAPLAASLRVAEGKHTLEAMLPSRPALLRELDLPGGSKLDVALVFPAPAPTPPALTAPAPAPPPLVGALPAPAPTSHLQRNVGYGLVAAGVVALAAGSVAAYEGAADANAARARAVVYASTATADVGKYDAAKLDFDNARTRNELGWTLVGFGAAALVVGGGLALWASRSSVSVGGSF